MKLQMTCWMCLGECRIHVYKQTVWDNKNVQEAKTSRIRVCGPSCSMNGGTKTTSTTCVKFPTTISKVNRCFPQSRQLLCWKLESSWLGRSQKSVPELKAETASSQMKQQQKPGWDGGDFAAFMSVQVWTLLSSFVPSTTFSSLRRPPPCSSMCSCSRDADSSWWGLFLLYQSWVWKHFWDTWSWSD